MTHQEERTREQSERASRASHAASQAFAEEGKERIGDLAAAQSEFLDRLQDINRRWAERLRVEATLGAEMATQLTTSRSWSDTTSAIQNWTSKHIDMAADDTRRFLNDSQQIMEASTRLWTSAGQTLRPAEGRGLMS